MPIHSKKILSSIKMKIVEALFVAAVLLSFSMNALAVEKNITLVTLEWPPYISQNLPGNGYVYEIVSAALKRSGYKVTTKFYPWARAVKLAQTGHVDGIYPEYFDKERARQFAFSTPLRGGPVGLYKHKSLSAQWAKNPQQDPIAALQALTKYKFGVVRGYINTEAFDNADFLNKEQVVSDDINLKMLYAKRTDFIFIDKFVAQYLIRTRYPNYERDLEFMEPAMEIKPLYIAFSKKAGGYKEKLAAFNQGLDLITEDGTLQRILTKHGF